ncbi:hypothetical protein ABZP36_001490 [Zizania latifolia]
MGSAPATAAVAFLTFADSSPAPSLLPSLSLSGTRARASPVSPCAIPRNKFTVPCASPHCSDEFSCYSGSSPSYSGTSAGSCVSDSAQRGSPVDPLRLLAVVSSIHRINPKSERDSPAASEGNIITGAASAGSTTTSGRSHRPPGVSGGGEQLPRRPDSIMKWFSRPETVAATETAIRAAVGDNAGTSKALHWLLMRQGCLRRAGTGGRGDPCVYMVSEIGAILPSVRIGNEYEVRCVFCVVE